MLGSCGAVLAQSTATDVNGVKTENKSVITTEATINGIPYSQYKAQQETLKRQQPNQPTQNKVVLAGVTENNSINGQTPTANALPSGNQQLTGKSSTITPQPVIKTQEPKAEKQNVQPVTEFKKPKGLEARVITTSDTKATPAVIKPVDTKGTSLEVKPVSENIKPSVEDKTTPSSVSPVATPKAPVSKQGGN